MIHLKKVLDPLRPIFIKGGGELSAKTEFPENKAITKNQ